MQRRNLIFPLFCVCLSASQLRGDVICEQWGGDGSLAHPRTMRTAYIGDRISLVFDLSALPPGTTIHHASLVCRAAGQPKNPPEIRVTGKVDAAGAPVAGGKPLELEAPWYGSFDVTEAVKQWVKDPRTNLGLVVEQFEGFLAAQTVLEIKADGKPARLPAPIGGVRAVHHDGQTFIRWQEIPEYRPKPEDVVWISEFSLNGQETTAAGPGKDAKGNSYHPAITLKTLRHLQGIAVRDKPGRGQGMDPMKRVRQVPDIRYRVYRHTEKITPANIASAERIGEAGALCGFEQEVYNCPFSGEWFSMYEEPKSPILTWCYEDDTPLMPGEGLCVHSAGKPGRAFYAVTTLLGGIENLSQLDANNCTEEPVEEAPAPPKPVRQLTLASAHAPEYWYRYWAGPPYYHLPDQPFRLVVRVPNLPAPRGLCLMPGIVPERGHMAMYNPPGSAVSLAAELPPLFYNDRQGTLRGVNAGKVDYFGERFLFHLLEWSAKEFQVDPKRITQALSLFGVRHPELFPMMRTGEYTDTYDLFYAPGGSALRGQLGPRGIQTVDGEDAWDNASIARYVRLHPERDVPFLICNSTTGKDSGHTSEFGWQDDPRGWAALRDARQPFVASWSCESLFPAELTAGLNAMKWDGAIPAFSNGSLDDNPGNGDPQEGDYNGAINAWLLWQEAGRVDKPDCWEMTVYLVPSCIRNECTVDITPRHCRAFKPQAGQNFKWTNTRLSENAAIQSGELTADRWNRVTAPQVVVGKARNRIRIETVR